MKSTICAAIAIIGLLAPALAFAAGPQFATQSVFLSQPDAQAGTSETIYASVVNTSDASFAGSVVFKDNGTQVGSVAVTLSAGEARVVSVSWVPTAGTHAITAQLVGSDGTGISSATASSTQATETFLVASPPPPPESATTQSSPNTVASSTAIQNSVTKALPPVASSTVATVFSVIDDARASAVVAINNEIARLMSDSSTTVANTVVTTITNSPSGITKDSIRVQDTSRASVPVEQALDSTGRQDVARTGASTATLSIATASAAATTSGMTVPANAALAGAYVAGLYALRFVLQNATLSYICIAALALFLGYLLFSFLRWRM